mmetsp:Transcript_712/g.1618  ORF Transcript_712/g.1618 Transcript_712/m.1618 type:complete len:219 (-) Transcript_712:86-742(-)
MLWFLGWVFETSAMCYYSPSSSSSSKRYLKIWAKISRSWVIFVLPFSFAFAMDSSNPSTVTLTALLSSSSISSKDIDFLKSVFATWLRKTWNFFLSWSILFSLSRSTPGTSNWGSLKARHLRKKFSIGLCGVISKYVLYPISNAKSWKILSVIKLIICVHPCIMEAFNLLNASISSSLSCSVFCLLAPFFSSFLSCCTISLVSAFFGSGFTPPVFGGS